MNGENAEQEKPVAIKKARKKKSARVKLTKFDKDLLESVKNGESDSLAISAASNLDPTEFSKRVKTLVKQKYLIQDAANPNVIRLGIKGYNAIAKKQVKSREEKKEEQPIIQETVKSVDLSKLPQPTEPSFFIKRQAEKQVQQPIQEKLPDLFELLEAYGPKKTSEIKEKISELKKNNPTISTTIEKIVSQGEMVSQEKCILCKAPFKLSLSSSSHPKYGHCFCGAAYHKDCYESLLDNGGKCINCGKKLKLTLDKQSEEAVKQIKKIFE